MLSLPLELQYIIFEQLLDDPKSLAYLMTVNKKLRVNVLSWDVWQKLTAYYFPRFYNMSSVDDIAMTASQMSLFEASIDPPMIPSTGDVKKAFVSKWRHMTAKSRGQTFVRGPDVSFGATSSTQMSASNVYGAFGTRLISCWDVSTGQVAKRYDSHQSQVLVVQVDHEYLVSSSTDCTMKVWNKETAELLLTISLGFPVRALRFDSRIIVSGDTVGWVRVHTLNGKLLLGIPSTHHRADINHIVYDSRYIATASADRVVQVYSRQKRRIVFYVEDFTSLVTSLAMCNEILLVGTWSGQIHAYRLNEVAEFDEMLYFEDDNLIQKQVLKQLGELREIRVDSGGTACHYERINTIQIIPAKAAHFFHLNEHEMQAHNLDKYPAFVTGSNDSTIGVWAARWNSLISKVQYQCLIKIEMEATVLCMEVVPKIEMGVLIVSSACLDGKIYHWHLSYAGNGYSSTDDQQMDVRIYSTEHKCQPIKIGSQATFNSTFLPFMVYQDFIQVLTTGEDHPTIDLNLTATGMEAMDFDDD